MNKIDRKFLVEPSMGVDIEFGPYKKNNLFIPKGRIPREELKEYWDGPLTEVRSCAHQCREEVYGDLLANLKDAMNNYSIDYFSVRPIINFNPEDFKKNKKALVLGCDISKNAYGYQGDLEGLKNLPFRTTGGHIHLGVQENTLNSANVKTSEKNFKNMIKNKADWFIGLLDRTIGLAGVLINPWPEEAGHRRQYYGLPGEYRIKSYGIEYRSLPTAELMLNRASFYAITCIAKEVCYLAQQASGGVKWATKKTKAIMGLANTDVLIGSMVNYDKDFASYVVGEVEKILCDDPVMSRQYVESAFVAIKKIAKSNIHREKIYEKNL